MSQLVDDLLLQQDHVKKICNDSEEYKNAIGRVNEIIEDTTKTNEERVRARSLGMALQATRNAMRGNPMEALGELLEGLASRSKHRETQDEADTISLSFGMTGYIRHDEGNNIIVAGVRVIGADNEKVCVSDDEGEVHWVERDGFFTDPAAAAVA